MSSLKAIFLKSFHLNFHDHKANLRIVKKINFFIVLSFLKENESRNKVFLKQANLLKNSSGYEHKLFKNYF